MPFTKHSVSMNLSHVSPEVIRAMDGLITSLQDNPAFGILYYSHIQALHQTQETKAGLHLNMTHNFNMLFCSSANRDYYLPHKEHLAVVEKLIDKGLTVKTGSVCAVDTDSHVDSAIAKIYLQRFCEKHNMQSIVDMLSFLDDQQLAAEVAKNLVKLAESYLVEQVNPDAFWINLMKHAELETIE